MTENKKHIAFFIPGFPENESDINCIPILQNYILYYHKMNPAIKISVISFQYPFKKRNYKWNGIDVYAIGGANKKGLYRILTWLKVFLCFKKLNTENKISVIHSFWLTQCAFIGQRIAALFKVKHILTIVGQDPLPSNRYLKIIGFSKATVVSLSEFAAKKFNATTGKKVNRVISIGLDVENFKTSISENPSVDILGVGNLHNVKNYKLFIEIIEQLVVIFPELKSIIVGTGKEFTMLKNLIEQKKLKKNVILAGEMTRYKVLELMTNSKILLHTSRHKGQGYVFAEALYSGMSIVAFCVGNLIVSERVALCKDKNEMLEHLNSFLKKKLDRKRILIQSMEKTVSAFNELYFSK